MDDVDLIADYAQRLAAALRRAGRPAQPLVDEATAHLLEDAACIARDEACGRDEAARRAITRFGDVAAVVGASRRHGRALAASVARISSIVLLVVLGWDVVTSVIADGLELDDLQFVLGFMFCDLGLVSYFLFRSLRGQARPGVLPIVLALNGTLAAALISTGLVVDGLVQLSNLHHLPLGLLLMVEPAWLLLLVHSAAGLWALGGSRNEDGELLIG